MIDMGVVRAEVEAARVELLDEEDNPKAILSLGARMRVWRAMIDPEDPEASYRRRIELKMACVRRVQHYWEHYHPGDQRVQEMLDLAQHLPFGGTTILIMVGVGLQTVKEVNSQLQQRHYEGFLS